MPGSTAGGTPAATLNRYPLRAGRGELERTRLGLLCESDTMSPKCSPLPLGEDQSEGSSRMYEYGYGAARPGFAWAAACWLSASTLRYVISSSGSLFARAVPM